MKKYPLILLFFSLIALPVFCQNQNDPVAAAKFWSEGPLTWADFQPRHVPDDSEQISEIRVFTYYDNEKRKTGNVRYTYRTINVYVDNLLSWYDPDKADEWQLRYNQIIFDLAHIYAKKRELELNGLSSTVRYDNNNYYHRLFISKSEALEMESDGGRDTVVIKRYEDEVRKELEEVNTLEPSIPVEGDVIWGLGVFWSYEFHAMLGSSSEKMGAFNGFGMTYDFRIKDMFFDVDMGCGWSPELKASNFYHDSKFNYDWRKGERISHYHANLNIGRLVVNKPKYRLIPYVGIGGTGLSQETEIEKADHKGQYEHSEISGLRLQAGLKTDLKLFHFNEGEAPYDIILRFNLYGAYDHFSGIGDLWSVYLGVSLGLDGYFLKSR